MAQTLTNLNINDNNAVISALREGDEEVFDHIYRYYFRGLCAFCSQYVTLSESEEIVQDTMMWLWENRKTLIPELTLKTLLFTIVKNKALNKISHFEIKRKVHQEIAEKYETELYEEALRKLPAEFRQAYEMNRSLQMTHKEIAEKLNVSPQTINYRIGQALKILRSELKDYLPLIMLFLFLQGHK